MQIDDVDAAALDGGDYFGDLIPGGSTDTDSEVPTEPQEAFEADPDTDVSDDADDEETGADDGPDDVDDTDPEDTADTEWLPGFENRFRVGEEGKALAAYSSLEAFHSKTVNELKAEQQAAEDRAYQRAKELLIGEAPQVTTLQRAQNRSELVGLAYQDPTTAFEAAVEDGDATSINAVVNAIGRGAPELGIDPNPVLANQLQNEYIQKKDSERYEAQEQKMQNFIASTNLEKGYREFEGVNSDLLQNEAFKGAFGEVLNAKIATMDTSSPQAVRAFLDECGDLAFGRVARAGGIPAVGAETTATDAPATNKRADKRAAAADTGKDRRASRTEDKPSASQEYASGIMEAARAARPSF